MKTLSNLPTPPPPSIPQRLFDVGGSRGVVAQHNVAWKTSVTSGGGGGYLERGTGYINPVWTRTDHIHWQEFWVRTHDGHENYYWLQGYEQVNLRQGHEVGVLMVNGTVTYLMNYTTGLIYAIAPLDRLLPLRAPMGGCAITTLTLFAAPFVGFLVMTAVGFCIGLVLNATIGAIPDNPPPAWRDTAIACIGIICIGGTMVASAVHLTRQARRVEAENGMLRARGRQELDAACQRCLGLKPVA